MKGGRDKLETRQNPIVATLLRGFNIGSAVLWLLVLVQLLFSNAGGVFSPGGYDGSYLFQGVPRGFSITALLRQPPTSTLFRKSLLVAQTIALLEIVFALANLVPSPIVPIVAQVLSRLHIVWIVWRSGKIGADSIAFGTCVGAWAIAELCRYPYYALITGRPKAKSTGNGKTKQLLGSRAEAILKWLRYSAFVVLYPIGIYSEVCCILYTLPAFRMSRSLSHWPTPMPNFLNFEVNLFWVYIAVLFLYVPGAAYLYRHMLKRRHKALAVSDQIEKPSAEAITKEDLAKEFSLGDSPSKKEA